MDTNSLEKIADGSVRNLLKKLLAIFLGTSLLAVFLTGVFADALVERLLDPAKLTLYRHLAFALDVIPYALFGILCAIGTFVYCMAKRHYADPLVAAEEWAQACLRDGVLHPCAVTTPVTEVNGLVRIVGALTGELHARVDEMADLPRDIRHSLVNCVTDIGNTAQLMVPHDTDDAKCIEQIVSTTETIREIMNLEVEIAENYSRIKGAPPVEVDVGAVVTDAVRRLGWRIDERHLALEMRLPDAPCVRLAHRQKLAAIVHNLVDNAVKYNRDGGTVRVTLAADGEDVRLAVADTGPGITESDRKDVIFHHGKRGSAATARNIPGSGHGLAYVRALARFYRGDITYTTTPGEGTTFTATLKLPLKGTNK